VFTQTRKGRVNQSLYFPSKNATVFSVNIFQVADNMITAFEAYEICRTVRSRKKIAQIKNVLRGQQRYRDLLLFVIGINTVLRISDLLQLQLSQFLDESGNIKRKFWIKEQKRGKRQEIAINQSMKDALEEYLEAYPYRAKATDNFLFFNPRTLQPLKRGQAWKFITVICKDVGLRGNYGTHSYEKHGAIMHECRGLILL
jgi:integrase